MKKIINGKVYNTDTATQVAQKTNGFNSNDRWYRSEELYKTTKGNYFSVDEHSKIHALTKEEAMQWVNGCTWCVDEIQKEFNLENA